MTLEHEVLAADEPPTAHEEDLDSGVRPFVVDADHVFVGN